jgi:hypothetical protein
VKKEVPVQMINEPGPDETPGNPADPNKPPRPKRGAFPTPKSEIEKAEPYIPHAGEDEDSQEVEPDQPTDIESEEEG